MEHNTSLVYTDEITDLKETYTCSRPLGSVSPDPRQGGAGEPGEKLTGEGISLGSVLSQRTQATLHQLVSHVQQSEPCLISVPPHSRGQDCTEERGAYPSLTFLSFHPRTGDSKPGIQKPENMDLKVEG